MMRVRQPVFEFEALDPHWAPNRTLVHNLNATGIIPAHIEPYLIKVMRQAKERLDPNQHPELLADIDTFIRQEAQHYKVHGALNRAVREGGYEGMADHEQRYAAELKQFLTDKSFRWNMAYCEGFEAIGSAGADAFIDGMMEGALQGGDPRPVEVWKWHLAEEYEHRTVAFRTYYALYGHQPIRAYLGRLYGYVVSVVHIQTTIAKLQRDLEATDRERQGLPPTEKRRGIDRTALTQLKIQLKKAAKVVSPFYDPARIGPPKKLETVLNLY